MKIEIEKDEETGEMTVSIEDVPDNWSWRHNYGRLDVYIPKKEEEA